MFNSKDINIKSYTILFEREKNKRENIHTQIKCV
jgi:hypothetical protein